ncbi:MAG: NUDIX hydrolase [Chloroflexi bacterium]|nr:NUDIX hydrolase [Chloroflexota bacterium]
MPDDADAAGCVVYRYDDDGRVLMLLIHDRYGRWTLPKGHRNDSESVEQAAVREVHEETGLTGELGAPIGTITYTVRKKGVPYRKRVTFFLMRTTSASATPEAAEGISAAEWVTPGDAQERAGYEKVRDIIARAATLIPPQT